MDLKPTEQMAKNAERGLRLRKEYGRGGTEVGVARATQLKNRENLSPETVKRMVSYFARHAGDNLSETDPPSAGYIAWLLWGGDAGRNWAERKAKQIDEQKENDMKAIEQKKLAIIKSNAAPEVKLRALEKLNGAEADSIASMANELKSAQQEVARLVEKYARPIARDDIDPQLAQKIKVSLGTALGKLSEASLGSRELAQKYKGAGR